MSLISFFDMSKLISVSLRSNKLLLPSACSLWACEKWVPVMHAVVISGECFGMSALLSHLFLLASLHASRCINGTGTTSIHVYRFTRTPSFRHDRATSWQCFGEQPRPPLLHCISPNFHVGRRIMFPFLYESALSRSSSIRLSAIVTTCTDGKSGVSTVAAAVILHHKSAWHGAQCWQWVCNVAAEANTDSTISSRASLYLMKPLLLTYSHKPIIYVHNTLWLCGWRWLWMCVHLFVTGRFVDLLLDDRYTTQTDRCPYREKGVCVLCYYTCLFVVEHMTLFNIV